MYSLGRPQARLVWGCAVIDALTTKFLPCHCKCLTMSTCHLPGTGDVGEKRKAEALSPTMASKPSVRASHLLVKHRHAPSLPNQQASLICKMAVILQTASCMTYSQTLPPSCTVDESPFAVTALSLPLVFHAWSIIPGIANHSREHCLVSQRALACPAYYTSWPHVCKESQKSQQLG